jgi:hypothetical protein
MRLQANVALVISGLVVLIGLYLALSRSGGDVAAFGWFLAAVGALFGVANLLLRTRM